MSQSVKPLIASVGAALALGSAMPANAADNPFASVELSSGYEVAAQKEGNCGGNQKSGEAKDKAKSKPKASQRRAVAVVFCIAMMAIFVILFF